MIDFGIHNLTFDEYKAIEALNNGTLVAFDKSPAHSQVEKNETPAMRFGRDYHTYQLEPERFEKEYAVMPEGMTRRGKKWEEFQAKNKGKEFVSHDDFNTMKAMDDSLCSGLYETAKNLVWNSAQKEKSIVWNHRKFKIPCKCRIDILNESLGIIADPKTCTNADPDQWIKTALNAKGNPHWQPAWYLEGVKTILGKNFTFLWILMETKPPYGISVVQATEEMVYLAQEQINILIPRYIESKNLGIWRGYPDRIVSGELPSYYMKNAL